MSVAILDADEKEEAAERYRDGESMPQIAERFGCHTTVIHRALRNLGVPSRTGSEAAG